MNSHTLMVVPRVEQAAQINRRNSNTGIQAVSPGGAIVGIRVDQIIVVDLPKIKYLAGRNFQPWFETILCRRNDPAIEPILL